MATEASVICPSRQNRREAKLRKPRDGNCEVRLSGSVSRGHPWPRDASYHKVNLLCTVHTAVFALGFA